jgi:hypothetical protein
VLKNSTGNLLVRNTGDTADASVTAAKVSVSGDILEINSDATAAAADWKYTLQRPTAGMAAALTLTLPVNAGSANQVLQTDGTGVLAWASAASTAACDKIDTTSLAFGTASPLALFSTGASDIINCIEVVVDTPFNGTPSLSIGVSGTTSKYLSATDVDLTAPAGSVFQVHPGLAAAGAEALIATYAASGATSGAARVLVYFATPA